MYARTGACAVHLESSNEVLLIGGRLDLNPSQSGDETPTDGVEIYDITNASWEQSDNQMSLTQMYFGCSTVNEKVYTIGDYHPFESPEIRSEGIVQIFNTANDSWGEGTSMPSGDGGRSGWSR